uniref:DUF19 domain-containing protein n=1 Tax=Romanomermis culicivorax TaxID=13658 RepID=A0A915KPP1_ROMCU
MRNCDDQLGTYQRPHLFVLCNSTILRDHENCTKSHFYCPDNCQLTWHNSCPYQCTCYPPRYCPAVKCPLPRPTCIIVTQTTINCPTCLCRTPVVTIKSTSKKANDTEFLYFEKKRFETKISWLYPEGRRKCGARSLANVDQCLNGFLQDRQSIKENFEPVDGSFNPLISLHRQNLVKTCDSYDEALSCMGPALYDRCKNVHFELAKYDALFGYVCGSKRKEYLAHHACLQELHRDSLKIKLCENLFFTSLLQLIQNTSLPVDQYFKQRCDIFRWMADCEKAAIQNYDDERPKHAKL